ncbi:MAG: DUF4388 domain-containing protein [Candidatus Methylacidiphilales bacterium]
MASILILEDNLTQANRLANGIRQAYPEIKILPARTVEEAQLFLSEYDDIGIFLLDIFLPDGNGIDFLCDVKTISPEAHALIMTANPDQASRQHALDLGVTAYFQKPLDPAAILLELAKILGPSNTSATPSDSFKASLGGLSTVDIIQLKCLARATQVIAFRRDDGLSGKIHFQRGEIVHAECSNQKSGLDAFNEIVSWKGGRVEESQEPIAEPTIKRGWESLLMDAVRMIDEANAA